MVSFSSAKVVDTVAGVVVGSLEMGSAVISTMGASVVATDVSGCEVDGSSETVEVDGLNVVTGDDELLAGTVTGAVAGIAVVEGMVVSGAADGLVLTTTVWVVSGTVAVVEGLAGLVTGLLVTTSVTTTAAGVEAAVVIGD